MILSGPLPPSWERESGGGSGLRIGHNRMSMASPPPHPALPHKGGGIRTRSAGTSMRPPSRSPHPEGRTARVIHRPILGGPIGVEGPLRDPGSPRIALLLDLFGVPDDPRLPAGAGVAGAPAQAAAIADEHDRLAAGDPAAALRRRAALPDVRRPEDPADGAPEGTHVPLTFPLAAGRLGEVALQVLRSYGVPPPTEGNRVELVARGEEAYARLVRMIDEAERTIHITTYILGRDRWASRSWRGWRVRASEGVAVRLLLDDVGSWRVGRRFLAPLTEAGAQVAFFMPVLHLPFRGRANLRNHRKIVVVDERHALTGGMNLASEYMGPTPDPRPLARPRRWSSTARPSATSRSCSGRTGSSPRARTWAYPEPRRLPRGRRPTTSSPRSSPAAPTSPATRSTSRWSRLIFAARRRIWIVTPYFVPDEMLARALDLAARRGVDVRLIVPARSNHITADLARGQLPPPDLTTPAGTCCSIEPVMLHAKAVICRRRARRHRVGEHGHAQPLPQLRGRPLRLVEDAGRGHRRLGTRVDGRVQARPPCPKPDPRAGRERRPAPLAAALRERWDDPGRLN